MQKSAPAIRNKSRDELAKIAGVSHDILNFELVIDGELFRYQYF